MRRNDFNRTVILPQFELLEPRLLLDGAPYVTGLCLADHNIDSMRGHVSVENGDTTAPTADLADPLNGESIDAAVLNGRGYVDVAFDDEGGSGLDAATILDSNEEFLFFGTAASGVSVNGAPTLVGGTPSTYRYSFTGSFAAGEVTVCFIEASWTDNALNPNEVDTEGFQVTSEAPPTADLYDPSNGQEVTRRTLNPEGRIVVSFVDNSGSGLNVATIIDSAPEFTLGGAAAAGVVVEGSGQLWYGSFFSYAFTGSFGPGPVSVEFIAGSWEDNDGHPNAAETEGFTVIVTGESADVVGRTIYGDWWAGVSNEAGFTNQHMLNSWLWSGAVPWLTILPADVNGDGLTDVVGRNAYGHWWACVSDGTTFTNQVMLDSWLWSSAVPWSNVLAADVNNDGLEDVVGLNACGDWWACISDGTGFRNQYMGNWGSATWYDVNVVDLNGDGMDDVVGRTIAGDWRAGISDGTSFDNQHMLNSWLWSGAVPWLNIMPADVNGDGKTDIVGRNACGHWWACISDGTQFTNQFMLDSSLWSSGVPWLNILKADVNGDNLDDVVGRNAYGHWWAVTSDGASLTNRYMCDSWVWSAAVPWVKMMSADINGDGLDDAVGLNAHGDWWAVTPDWVTSGNPHIVLLKFFDSYWGNWGSATWYDVMTADLNAESLTLVGVSQRVEPTTDGEADQRLTAYPEAITARVLSGRVTDVSKGNGFALFSAPISGAPAPEALPGSRNELSLSPILGSRLSWAVLTKRRGALNDVLSLQVLPQLLVDLCD